MEDVRQLMKKYYIEYASKVIQDRAIPDIVDGLKPVQRRILYTLYRMHDGKLHKVANVAGQTMALHPHGDAPITEALVNMANKAYLLDMQGNFGNILTGDPPAASRYIETRLSPLAKEALFNDAITKSVASYDGRHQEPICLPAKIPVLLLQGTEGIAVGMATHILPHNFVEVVEAEIALLEGKEFLLLPDFLTGGTMDASEYNRGRGKVRLRAKMEIRDPKTVVIREICYGTTTESLIRSIDEAAKKGKIKIDGIHDYTASEVEIEITLPRGYYAEDLIQALYAYTECQVSITSQVIVIKDDLPIETDIHEILRFHAEKLQEYLQRELEIEQYELSEKIFAKTLEQIFIENRLYKSIETLTSYEEIHQSIAKGLQPFHGELKRVPGEEDRERLLNIPIRRISRFDIEKNQKEIREIEQGLVEVEKSLKQIKKVAIAYLKNLLKKYGKEFPRRTSLEQIEQLDLKAISTRSIKVGFDPVGGFVGTKVGGPHLFECTNYDKLLLFFDNGTYSVINIPEKQYVHHAGAKLVYVGAADKKTVINVAYKDPKSHLVYSKRFIITQFILEKSYRYFDEGMNLVLLTTQPAVLELIFIPKIKQKTTKTTFSFDQALVKGVSAKGVRISPREVKKIVVISNGSGSKNSSSS